jgi:hypothetical protein
MELLNQKIFILGDSFAEIDQEYDYLWQLKLAEDLKRDLVNVAANGASSGWLLLKLMEIDKHINPDDLLVLIIPYWERVCIWPQSPDLTSLISVDQIYSNKRITKKWEKYSKNEIDAFVKYFLYLKNDEIISSLQYALQNWVNSIGSRLIKKPLLIYGHQQNIEKIYLNNCNYAQGELITASISEFQSLEIWDKICSAAPFVDPRICHFSKQNHLVLKNKILDYFSKDIIPDLQVGFESAIITDLDSYQR